MLDSLFEHWSKASLAQDIIWMVDYLVTTGSADLSLDINANWKLLLNPPYCMFSGVSLW